MQERREFAVNGGMRVRSVKSKVEKLYRNLNYPGSCPIQRHSLLKNCIFPFPSYGDTFADPRGCHCNRRPLYTEAKVDVTQEIEQRAQQAAQAGANHCALCSISCVTSTLASGKSTVADVRYKHDALRTITKEHSAVLFVSTGFIVC